ncbi:UNVERIFIED_CONTAM: hypothetical protein FKN15_036012 [Acipenser sinensis]
MGLHGMKDNSNACFATVPRQLQFMTQFPEENQQVRCLSIVHTGLQAAKE